MTDNRNVPAQKDLDDQVRALYAAGQGCREIARNLDTSAATVSRIAARLGLSFDGSRTAAAAAALASDHRARRAELSDRFLDLAETAVSRAETAAGTGDADADVAATVRQWAIVAGIAADKHSVLHRVDYGDRMNVHQTFASTPGLNSDLVRLAEFVTTLDEGATGE